MTLWAIVAVALGYLVGSVDFAVVVARARGADIYQQGSGNPGAANVLRILGWKAALPVMIGDAAKGVAAAAIGTLVGGSEVAGYSAGFAAVLGHVFPIWHRFRGGKGVATAFGMVLWLEPVAGAILAATWLTLLLVTRISSVGSLAAMVLAVPVVAAFRPPPWAYLWLGAVAALVIVRHRENIGRLLSGTERRTAA